MHLIALHEHGSSNPLGITGNIDRLPFSPYFVFKDLITVFVFLTVYSCFIFFSPNSLGRMALILIISQCAICWKYLLIYNKTQNISGLYLNSALIFFKSDIRDNYYPLKYAYYYFTNIYFNIKAQIKENSINLFRYYANPN